MFLKTLYHKITNTIFSSKTESKNEANTDTKSNNYVDVLLSLTEDFHIDLVIYINDKPNERVTLSEIEYGMVCAEFLNNCFTPSIKQKLLSVIDKDIKNKENETLISIVNMACSISSKPMDDDTFIRPSQVFATNNHA